MDKTTAVDKIAMRVAVSAGAASADQLRAAVLAILEKAAAWRTQGGVGQLCGNELLVALAEPLGAPIEFGPYGSLVDRAGLGTPGSQVEGRLT